jgi:hypothetical protein
MTSITGLRQQVLDRADIAEIAQECGFRKGRWKGWHCPWHGDGEDRRPSASIRGRWLRCFACGESWDAIGMLMRAYRLGFSAALTVLAARLGILTSGPTQRERREYVQRRREAEREGRQLLDWRDGILEQLRAWRDTHLRAYHRAKRSILHHTLDSETGSFAADVAEVAAVNYQRLDHQIAQIKTASFQELLAHFRSFKGVMA